MRREIIHQCAEVFNVHPRDLLSHSRFEFLLGPRFALYAALRQRGSTYSQIGRWLNRDHSTVIYGIRRSEWIAERNPDYAAKIDYLVNWKPQPAPLPIEEEDHEATLRRDIIEEADHCAQT